MLVTPRKRSDGVPDGMVMTTMGLRAARPPVCGSCGERREGQLYTVDLNGREICAECARPEDAEILRFASEAGD
jgi:hypothetical protein